MDILKSNSNFFKFWKSTILIVVLLNPFYTFGQTYKRIDRTELNNSISIYYTLGIGKTNLNRDAFGNSGDLSRHIRDEGRTKFTYGFNFGYMQKMKLYERVWLGIGIGFEEKAEVSFPTVYNNPGNPITQISDYFYKLQIQSYQIPIEITFEDYFFKYRTAKFKYVIGLNLIPDIYGRYKGYRFLKIRSTGEKRILINGKDKFNYDSSHISNFSNHLGKGYLRLGLGTKFGIKFQMNKFVYYGANIEANFYSHLLNNGENIVKGDASLIGLKINCGLNF